MFKKIVVFTSLLLCFLVPNLATNVNAATDVSLLTNITPTWSNNPNNVSKAFNDQIPSTHGGWIRDMYQEYTFIAPVHVSYFTARGDGGPEDMYLTLRFMDGTSQTFDISFNGGTRITNFPIDKDNVIGYRFGAKPNWVKNSVDFNDYDLKGYDMPITTNPEPHVFVINNLVFNKTSDISGTLRWDQLSSTKYLKEYRVYHDNTLIAQTLNTSYSVSSLKLGQTHEFKVTAFDTFGVEYNPARIDYTTPQPDTTPPGQPTGLTVTPDRYSALVKWTGPTDPDLEGFYVYLDGRLVSTLVKVEQFSLGNLKMDTDYEVYVQAVDKSGNKSIDSNVVKFKTLGLTTVPSAVYGLTGTPYSGSISLNYSASPGATHYEIWMNGSKLMETKNTFTNIHNLNNGTAYTFYVVAVNSIGPAAPSNTVTVTPSAALPPNVTLGYGLQDVSNGVGTWFGGIWLILAFAISIPLAFFVANRLKGFFAT